MTAKEAIELIEKSKSITVIPKAILADVFKILDSDYHEADIQFMCFGRSAHITRMGKFIKKGTEPIKNF